MHSHLTMLFYAIFIDNYVYLAALKSPVKTPTSRSGSVAASAFDQNTLNSNQFVQLIGVFLGEEPPEEVVQSVIKFIQGGYVETEEEKFNRLQKVRARAFKTCIFFFFFFNVMTVPDLL